MFIFIYADLAEAPTKATFRSSLSGMLSLDWLVTDAPFNEGLNCLMISVSVWNEQQFQLLLAFQYNFCFESSLVNQVQSVHKSMCTVCVHTL